MYSSTFAMTCPLQGSGRGSRGGNGSRARARARARARTKSKRAKGKRRSCSGWRKLHGKLNISKMKGRTVKKRHTEGGRLLRLGVEERGGRAASLSAKSPGKWLKVCPLNVAGP